MGKRSSKAIGDDFEQKACDFLIRQGYTIIATNWRVAGVGELDIVAYHTTINRHRQQKTLVGVEVKARKKHGLVKATETITHAKQQKLIATMQYFLQCHTAYADVDVRFDVLAFDVGVGGQFDLEWVQGAFLA